MFKLITNRKNIGKYIKFKKRIDIFNDRNRFICPYPDCEEYADKNVNYKDIIEKDFIKQSQCGSNFKTLETEASANLLTHSVFMSYRQLHEIDIKPNDEEIYFKDTNKFLMCSAGHKFCMHCKKLEWHVNRTCNPIQETEEDYNLHKSTLDLELKNCPYCGIFIEKLIGCNHIRCPSCYRQWCWLCIQEFNKEHYSSQESKCFGRMYDGSNPVSDVIQNNVDWFYEDAQTGGLRDVNFVRNQETWRQGSFVSHSENFVIGYKYFKIEIKNFRCCLVRLFYFLIFIFFLFITNYGILKAVSSYLDQKFYSIYGSVISGKKYKHYMIDIIKIFVAISIWLFTFFIGIILYIGIYIPSLFNYVISG